MENERNASETSHEYDDPELGFDIPVMVNATTETALARVDPSKLRHVIEENLGPNGLGLHQLDQVRVGLGGNTHFLIPSAEGETQEKEITGVILHAQDVRRFWPVGMEESGGSAPPACSSDDARVGVGDPGGDCHLCPHGAFREGQPPRCKQQRLLLILRPGTLLPLVVVVPPSSLAVLSKYFLRLTAQALPYLSVITSLTLERARSANGIAYSRIVARLAERLDAEEVARMQGCARVLRDVLRSSTHRSHTVPF